MHLLLMQKRHVLSQPFSEVLSEKRNALLARARTLHFVTAFFTKPDENRNTLDASSLHFGIVFWHCVLSYFPLLLTPIYFFTTRKLVHFPTF